MYGKIRKDLGKFVTDDLRRHKQKGRRHETENDGGKLSKELPLQKGKK